MRLSWLLVLALGLLPRPADARSVRPEPPPPILPSDFWREIVEPHADEVAMLVRKARDLLREPADAVEGDYEWAVEHRRQFFDDAYHLMRYARTLSPTNLEVLALLAETADETGRTTVALEALEAYVRQAGPDRMPAVLCSRLGAVHARLGRVDDAIRWFRQAQSTGQPGTWIVHLAHALAARGDVAGGIEALVGALDGQRSSFSTENAILGFALAVQYDRDEQRSAAFDQLDALMRSLQQAYGTTLKTAIAELRFAAPADRHYYRGLLYESLGHYVEARAEWAHYAAFPEAAWRARALDHVTRIDAARRLRPRPVPPAVIQRKVPTVP